MKHRHISWCESLSRGGRWAGCRSCGVARSIIVGFHPADPGSNPGTSTLQFLCYAVMLLRVAYEDETSLLKFLGIDGFSAEHSTNRKGIEPGFEPLHEHTRGEKELNCFEDTLDETSDGRYRVIEVKLPKPDTDRSLEQSDCCLAQSSSVSNIVSVFDNSIARLSSSARSSLLSPVSRSISWILSSSSRASSRCLRRFLSSRVIWRLAAR